MADVSVEFGAKDVGLEDSLKKIQSEMQTLEGKVKSGELSFEELESTMKRLGQVERLEKQLQAIGEKSDGAAPKVDELSKDIKDTGDKAEDTGKKSEWGFGKIAAGAAIAGAAAKAGMAVMDAAFAAVRGTIQGFTDALDLGGRLSDLSASTGETAGKLLVLERAFDNNGLGAEKVGSSIAKMQKNIEDARDGSGTAANAFAMMGVKVEELEGKLPTEQFKILSSGIQSIDDPTQRAAAAMGVFGKSGAELLPLLTNLDGELADARATVGSMAEIMDRRNATFDAVSDRFKTIGEKVRDFAAGILDKALPAIDAITTALSRIDAAKIGQNLADAFLGGQNAMRGFQASVDAIKTGNISAAFSIFWDSLQLQAAQTANEIYRRLIAAFESAGQFLGKIFDPSAPMLQTVLSGFELLGNKITESIAKNLAKAFSGSVLTKGLSSALYDVSTDSAKAGIKIEQNLKGAGGRIADQFIEAGKALPKSFEENYAKVPPLFNNLEGLQKKIEDQEQAIKKTTEDTNAEREKTTAQLEKEKEERAKIRAEAEAAAEEEKANAVALVELETAINEAKATGNEELVKSLESEKKRLDDQKEIAKLTEEYKTKLGVNADEAARLATNFVNAKSAAAAIGNKDATVTITTKVDDTRWKDLLAELAINKDPKTIAVALEVTGKSNLKDAQITLQNMEKANKNFEAAFKVIGARSIEEVAANLNGIPTEAQKQLALQITGEKDIDRAIGKLDSFAGTKTAKALLETQGFEKMDDLQNALKGVVGEKRTKAIVETLGLQNAEQAKEAIAAILRNNGKKTTVTATADTTPAQNALKSLDKRAVTLNASADTSKAQQAIENLGSKAIKGNLDASASIQDIRKQLEKEVDLGLNTSEGNKILGNIEGLMGELKSVMETLSQKLPTPALV